MKTNYLNVAALLFVLAACSNDEPVREVIDDSQPVLAQFIGCIDKVQTRVDGVVWNKDDAIGISGGEYTNIKYLADTKGTDRHFTTETESDAIYFNEKATVSFVAYHPYTGTAGTAAGVINKTITAAEQEEATRHQIDFMFGSGSGNKSAAQVALDLQHKMSMVTLNFKSGGGEIDRLISYTLKDLKMSGSFDTSNGAVQVTDDATNLTIIPSGNSGSIYTKSLILYPQKLGASIPIEVIWSGQTISGELKIDENTLMGNSNYISDITVSKAGLEINTIKAEWNDSETTSTAQKNTSFYGVLPEITPVDGISELKATVDGNVPQMEDGNYVLSAGQILKISFKVNSGKMVKSFDGWVTEGICKRELSKEGDYCVCSYSDFKADFTVGDLNLATMDAPTNLPATAPMVGDYYYSDGTWSTDLNPDKTCIGIVFKAGVGNGETGFMQWNKINGYAIALQNVSTDRKAFAKNVDLPELGIGYGSYVGHSITHQIAQRTDFNEDNYWAVWKALKYQESVATPEFTSGWYVPSLAEFMDLCPYMVTNPNVEGLIEVNIGKAGGTKMRVNEGVYWSVSKPKESDKRPAAYDFGWMSYREPALRIHMESYSNTSRVRPVLAF